MLFNYLIDCIANQIDIARSLDHTSHMIIQYRSNDVGKIMKIK